MNQEEIFEKVKSENEGIHLICTLVKKLLKERKYFKTWLMRILINECKDIFRQKNHDTELDNFAEGVHCEELDLCEWKQLLLCLDEESRKIVELYYFDEFSVKEISALLEMNSSTVSTKLSRARAKLKKVIRR